MYIATSLTNWSGLSITKMRSFDTLEGALTYIRKLAGIKDYYDPQPEWFRVYEIFNDKQPRLVKLTKEDLNER